MNQLQDQRVVFKQGPTGSVWALERSVKDRLNKGHRPAKRAGTDPTTGFQVSPTQWHAWSSTSTVTWPTLVCLLALQPGRGQLANLLFGKSMVVTCSSTWLGDPPFIFACRLGGVDKFLRYSGTSWDDRVQTYCQGTVLGGLTMGSLESVSLCPSARACPVHSSGRSSERELVLVFGRETLSFSQFRIQPQLP